MMTYCSKYAKTVKDAQELVLKYMKTLPKKQEFLDVPSESYPNMKEVNLQNFRVYLEKQKE
jgi:hypothetical protein